MRDREAIDSELRRIALRRQSIRERGGQPSSREVDDLLDELLAYSAGASPGNVVQPRDTEVAAGVERNKIRAARRRRHGVPRRLTLLAALPLSLVAVGVAAVVMFSTHHPDSSAQQTETPPSAVPPRSPITPAAPAPRIDIADAAFIAALKRQGVPVPSQDYVTAQGHAVCDFLAHQPKFADAVGFVQRSSIWDATQSAEVTAGAIVAYCPRSEPAPADEMQSAYQTALSELQAVEGKLQGIQRGLEGIPGHP